MRSFYRRLVFVSWFLACPIAAQDLSGFLQEDGTYLFSGETPVRLDELHLNTIDGGERPQLRQLGDVTTPNVRIDDGTYTIVAGTLSTDRLALGDPAFTGLNATNNGGDLWIGLAPFPNGPALLAEPVTLPRLDVRSALGNLVPIPADQMHRVPFEQVTSNTPFLISLESPIQPVVVSQDPLTLPIGYNSFSLQSGDVLISVGDGDRTLESHFRQVGGNVNVDGNLELCVPAQTTLPVVDVTNGITNKVLYEHLGGNLTVAGDMVVASSGAVPAEYIQTGGSTTIHGTLNIGGTGGSARLEGGDLTARKISANGNLHVGDATTITVGELVLWSDFTSTEDAPHVI